MFVYVLKAGDFLTRGCDETIDIFVTLGGAEKARQAYIKRNSFRLGLRVYIYAHECGQ